MNLGSGAKKGSSPICWTNPYPVAKVAETQRAFRRPARARLLDWLTATNTATPARMSAERKRKSHALVTCQADAIARIRNTSKEGGSTVRPAWPRQSAIAPPKSTPPPTSRKSISFRQYASSKAQGEIARGSRRQRTPTAREGMATIATNLLSLAPGNDAPASAKADSSHPVLPDAIWSLPGVRALCGAFRTLATQQQDEYHTEADP